MGKLSLVEQALLLHKEYYGEGDFGTVVKIMIIILKLLRFL